MAKNYKFIAFDIETYSLEHPFGISVAATVERGYSPRAWHGDLTTPTPMSQFQAAELVAYMTEKRLDGWTLLTWNGLAFDFKVLAEVSGLSSEVGSIALASVDMMFHFFCLYGFRLGLDTLAHGLGLLGKDGHEEVEGEKAPVKWQESEQARRQVIEYCKGDVGQTLAVSELVSAKSAFTWTSKKGRPMNKFFDSKRGWLTVADCLKLPLPDTSWMGDGAIPRESFYEWIDLTQGAVA